LTAACVLGLIITAGCSKSGKEAATAPSSPTASAGQKPDTVNGGKIVGKISFNGNKPDSRPIDMSANPACAKAHPAPVASEEVMVNGNGTLANVFVWVKNGVPEGKWAAPAKAAVVDQQGCIYKPHVSGVVVGQPIEFTNSDDTNHNIHPLPRENQEWNESQPPRGNPKTKSFDREEVMIPVKCNIHPWMRAYIGVVSHPFFAVTGDDGTYTLKGLPPGTYTIEIVHEKYGKQDVQVTVAAKDIKTLDFAFAK